MMSRENLRRVRVRAQDEDARETVERDSGARGVVTITCITPNVGTL